MVKSNWMHLKILKSRIWKLTKLSMRLRMMKAWRWNFLDKEPPMKTLGDIELEFRNKELWDELSVMVRNESWRILQIQKAGVDKSGDWDTVRTRGDDI